MTKEPELSIEFVHNNYWLCKRGTYEESSVRAGEEYRILLTPYDSLKEAQEANPDVPYSDEAAPYQADLSHNAPSWFDPSAAGEVWSEDDY